jgi:hypothetical protein
MFPVDWIVTESCRSTITNANLARWPEYIAVLPQFGLRSKSVPNFLLAPGHTRAGVLQRRLSAPHGVPPIVLAGWLSGLPSPLRRIPALLTLQWRDFEQLAANLNQNASTRSAFQKIRDSILLVEKIVAEYTFFLSPPPSFVFA